MLTRTLGAIALVAALAGTASASPLLLYASFDFDFDPDPTTSIPLAVGPWHVGALGGPAATAGDLHQVLSNLTSLVIGGTGTAVDFGGGVTGGFGFSLTNANLGGSVSTDFSTGFEGWWVTGAAELLGWSSFGGAPGGIMSVSSFSISPAFVGFLSSPIYSGNVDAAFGNNLTFRFAAGDAPWHPPYDFASGRAILAGDDGVNAVPEPSSLFLLGTGVFGLIARLRSRRKNSQPQGKDGGQGRN